MSEILLQAVDISKDFGSTKALKSVNLCVKKGEILGLVGENGSGKSTFSSILAGINRQSSGTLTLLSQDYVPLNTTDAQSKGVGMIVQELGTVSGISIAENLFLGQENKFGRIFINKKKMISTANKALKEFGCDFMEAGDPVDALDQQDKKLVEVVKVMMSNPLIMIVDESTTALSQRGRNIIYKLIKEQKEKNNSVIFISHDLEEIMEQCDRLIVLRDGRFVAEIGKDEFDENVIKQKLIGREMEGDYYPKHMPKAYNTEAPVVKVQNVYSPSGLDNINLTINRGEILGIGGLSHCGMHNLGKILFGAEPINSGVVTYIPQNKPIKNVSTAMKFGFGYVSKDRDKEALVLDGSIKNNISICGLDNIKKFKFLILSNAENQYTDKQILSLSIKCQDRDQAVGNLSGGNKQKVVFGKWVGRNTDVLILDCPTRGVDIGVKAAMYKLMDKMRKEGKAIIMISEELTELIGMSDRLIIMKNGKIVLETNDKDHMTESNLINYMI